MTHSTTVQTSWQEAINTGAKGPGGRVLLPGPSSSGPEIDSRSILVHFNYCKNLTAPGQIPATVREDGSDKALGSRKVGVLNKHTWHRPQRSTCLSPPLRFFTSLLLRAGGGLWDWLTPWSLLWSLHLSPQSSQSGGFLCSVKKQEAKELSVTKASEKSCLTLPCGMRAQVENGDLPRLPLRGPWCCCSTQ